MRHGVEPYCGLRFRAGLDAPVTLACERIQGVPLKASVPINFQEK